MKSRTKMTFKNIFYGYIANIISLVLNFVSRTIFIKMIGTAYLGINGLFTNVLGVLSFAELGIGTALNFSLYKPVAENNKEKIKSIMNLYKMSYRVIAVLIAIIGLILLPFLKFIVKDPGDIGNINIYYLIFLFNTVTGYFVSYKFSLVNAEQKNYIMTNINTLIVFIEKMLQIIALLVFRSFLVYLLTASVIGLLQKIFINIYLNKLYPYLLEKNVEKLDTCELKSIRKNVSGLIWHKVGDVCVHQTDNIIISSFVNITTVGIVSNYNLIIMTVSNFINIIFNSVTCSLGNLIALENKKKQYEIFKTYRFVGFWLYGFSAIAFYILLSPFITLWLGENMLIPTIVILLILIDYYLKGQRICINNLKTAGGIFVEDKYVAILQAVVNIVVSVVMVNIIGLPGVYVGTVVQGLLSSIIKPCIIYKKMFEISSIEYFKDSIKYIFSVALALLLCIILDKIILIEALIMNFIFMCFVVMIIPNLIFYILFCRTKEFSNIKKMLVKKRG